LESYLQPITVTLPWWGVAAVSLVAIGFIAKRLKPRKSWAESSKSFKADVQNPQEDVVYAFVPTTGFSAVNLSPYSLKVMAWLKATGVPHKVIVSNRPGPYGQFPFVSLNGEVIADSSEIIDRLSAHFGKNLDADLGEDERGHIVAYQRMIEEHLNNVILYWRWITPEGWKAWNKEVFGFIPFPFNLFVPSMLRGGVKKRLVANGAGRHKFEEVLHYAKKDLDAVASLLHDKPYMLGLNLSTLDIVVFSFLYQILLPKQPNPIADYVRGKHVNLVTFVERMDKQLFG